MFVLVLLVAVGAAGYWIGRGGQRPFFRDQPRCDVRSEGVPSRGDIPPWIWVAAVAVIVIALAGMVGPGLADFALEGPDGPFGPAAFGP